MEDKLISVFKEISPFKNKINDAINDLVTHISKDSHTLEGKGSIEDKLKGDQITGLIGEYYVAKLLNGKIVSGEVDDFDVRQSDERIEVKTRCIGNGKSWHASSSISNPELSDSGPTHLCFVLLNNDYSVNRIWKFPWKKSLFKEKYVQKIFRGYYFRLSMKEHFNNPEFLIYKAD